MNKNKRIRKIIGIFSLLVAMALLTAPEMAEAARSFNTVAKNSGGESIAMRRGGRSFGGSRRSFNRRKSTTPNRSRNRTATRTRKPNPTSFGGRRLSSPTAYTSKYGTPRKTTSRTVSQNGQQKQYVMHGYGGYGSGLMTGYVMGSTSLLWMTPFHPAFYYTRPYYHTNADGTIGVYPPTFSFGKVLFALLIFAALGYIIYRVFFKKKRSSYNKEEEYHHSSFG